MIHQQLSEVCNAYHYNKISKYTSSLSQRHHILLQRQCLPLYMLVCILIATTTTTTTTDYIFQLRNMIYCGTDRELLVSYRDDRYDDRVSRRGLVGIVPIVNGYIFTSSSPSSKNSINKKGNSRYSPSSSSSSSSSSLEPQRRIISSGTFLSSKKIESNEIVRDDQISKNSDLAISVSNTATTINNDNTNEKNVAYLQSLYDNLQTALDKYIINGNKLHKQSAYNILEQIEQYSENNINDCNYEMNEGQDDSNTKTTYRERAKRLIQRAGLPLPKSVDQQTILQETTTNNTEKTETQETVVSGVVTFGWSSSNTDQRRDEANIRKEWEQQQQQQQQSNIVNNNYNDNNGSTSDGQFVSTSSQQPLQREQQFIGEKTLLQSEMNMDSTLDSKNENNVITNDTSSTTMNTALNRVSALMASRERQGMKLDGLSLGIGGLDDIIQQIHRRIYIPLVAPPLLLQQLGITPVRGMLLYGPPGCGKTLLARQIGQYLSPLRPITVVSGPEIMDKFVGSSESKLRAIFDNPPNLYESIRTKESDQGVALSKVALHVIIMDEFDAIARQRGGRDGGGDQGDAGVARDSVVNQLLAKMDGVLQLVVPTLVIGVTNKRSLIDTALLRPGRFEVQIEVPPPTTIEQRVSILKIHTRHMQQAGRLLVQDAPMGSAAAEIIANSEATDVALIPTYEQLLQSIANKTETFTGASLAAIVRAAASFGLERSVTSYFSDNGMNSGMLQDCVVTLEDFDVARNDFDNMDGTDSTVEKSP